MGAKARAELAAARADPNKRREASPQAQAEATARCDAVGPFGDLCNAPAVRLLRVVGGNRHGKTFKVCPSLRCAAGLAGPDADWSRSTTEPLPGAR